MAAALDVRALLIARLGQLVGALKTAGDPAGAHGCHRRDARAKITRCRPAGLPAEAAADPLERPAHHQVAGRTRLEGEARDEIARQRVGEVDDPRKLVVGHVHEGCVQRTIGQQPGQPDPAGVVEVHEQTTRHRAAAGIHRQRIHGVVKAPAGIERGVQAAVGIEPGDLAAEPQVHVVEIPADDDPLRPRRHGLRGRADHRRQRAVIIPDRLLIGVVALIDDDPQHRVGRRSKRDGNARPAVGQTGGKQLHRGRTARESQIVGAEINVDGVGDEVELVVQGQHAGDQRPRRSRHGHRHHEVKDVLRKTAGRRTIDTRVDHEAVGNDRQAVVQGDGEHRAIRARARIERQVERARRAQARDSVAGHAVDHGEFAAQDHFAVGLDFHRINRPVDPAAGIEAGVERPVGVEPRDVIPIRAVEGGEFARDHHLAVVDPVRVQRHGPHRSVRSVTGIEGGIHHPVGEQPGDVIPADAVERGETAADHDGTAVGRAAPVNRHGAHEIIGPHAGRKAEIQRAIGVHPRHPAALEGVHRREIATHHRLAVRLHRNREHRLVGARIRIQRRIGNVVCFRIVIAITRAGGLIVHRHH